MMNKIPQTLHDIIAYLDNKYPERTPREDTSAFDRGVEAGKRMVVDNLKRELDYINIQEKEK